MIDILVPILGRPPNAMLRSLEFATTTPYKVFFICSPGDTEQIAICKTQPHMTWVVPWEPGPADFAKKINWGFTHTESPWLFNAADDIRFSPGWDTAALDVHRVTGALVVGTNDLHNPAVKHGTHATHILFARRYILEYGGTFDTTGAVFSERYDHQFVDNEFIDLAKRRKVWAFAKESVVEHLHPVWGLAQWDATYEKAFRATDTDRKLYEIRRKALMHAKV